MSRKVINRVGEQKYNNQNLLMTIIEYRNSQDIDVKFEDGYISKNKKYCHFLNGKIKNHQYNDVLNVGCSGEKYQTKKNGTHTQEYILWRGMLFRCFDEKYKEKEPTYKDAACCEEWLLYDNFYEWVHKQDNYLTLINNNIKFGLDKDIMVKGNKLYSPETCFLVPNNVNALFTKNDAKRSNLPIGVYLGRRAIHYSSRCSNPYGDRIIHHGFNTPEEAFYQYKKDKEMIIKEVANKEYSIRAITKECYDAMYRYNVEITD